VAVNGVKQAALLLGPSNESNALWPVKVRGDLLNPGKNALTYTFDLHLPQANCATRFYAQAWGVIQAESTIQTIFRTELPRIVLSRFPLALEKKTLVILPTQQNIQEINTIVQFFLKLGSLLGFDAPVFQIFGADEVDLALLKEHAAILVGTVQNNPWIAKAMATAPFKIDHDNLILNDKNKQISIQQKAPLGVVELMDSPWNRNANILLITGTTAETIEWAIRLLSEDKLRAQLTGNIATINANSKLVNYETRPELSWDIKQGLTKKNREIIATFIYQNLSFVLIFIFLIIVLLLAIIGFYKRRKNT